MDDMTTDEIYERFGQPFEIPVVRNDKATLGPEAPSNAIIPMNLIVPSNEVVDSKIKITDFGTSFFVDGPPAKLHTPTSLLPPEAFFHEPIGPPADIWTLGCTLFDILGERTVFETWADDRDDVIAEMVSALRNLPTRWWRKWKKRPDFFLEDGKSWNPKFDRMQTPVFRPLEQRLRQMGRGSTPETCELDEAERASLKSLLSAMLVYEPSERITADGAMHSAFLQPWVRPAALQLAYTCFLSRNIYVSFPRQSQCQSLDFIIVRC
jgi:serine/threonine protein kinase